jgi:hypothetical protein
MSSHYFVSLSLSWQVRLARLGYNVFRKSETSGTVISTGAGRQRERVVDITLRACTCTFWQQRGFPCRHGILFAQRFLRPMMASQEQWLGGYFRRCFQVKTMVTAYSLNLTVPSSDDLEADGTTLPALKVKEAGAPRKRRFRSAGEGAGGRVGKPKRTQQCSRCGSKSHNVRSCTIDAPAL